jgi:hypothetical protein
MNGDSRQGFVVGHYCVGLFLGALFFWLLGGFVLLYVIFFWPKLFKLWLESFALGILGLGTLLGWLAWRWSGSFVLDDHAITWYNRAGWKRLRLPLDEVRHVRFNWRGALVIEGTRPGVVLSIPVACEGFYLFFWQLQTSVRAPWASLVEGPKQGRSQPSSAAPFASPRPAEPLPLIHGRWFRVGLVVIFGLGMGVLALAMWHDPSFMLPDTPFQRLARERAQVQEVVKYICSGLSLIALIGAFFVRGEFRIDEGGVEERYLFRSRRYGWADLAFVYVSTDSPHYAGALRVIPKEGRPLTLLLGERSYAFCDAAVAAASRGGHSVVVRGGPPLPEPQGPTASEGPTSAGPSEAIQTPRRRAYRKERNADEGGPETR